MPYKISGNTTESGTVYVVQNKVYKGYKDVEAGDYEVIFDADAGNNTLSVCEDVDGDALAYGGVTAISTASGTNITPPTGGGFGIKSIQRGIVDCGPAGHTYDTINAVDMDKSIVMLLGFSADNAQTRYVFSGIQLTSSTQVYALGSAGNTVNEVLYQVIEFDGGVQSVQRGRIDILAGNLTADYTINIVDMSKCMLVHNGNRGNVIEEEERLVAHLSFVNSTTLRATKGFVDDGTSWLYFDLLEFE